MEKELIKLILEMGKIIRYMDENSVYPEYWLNDGDKSDYVPALNEILDNHKS